MPILTQDHVKEFRRGLCPRVGVLLGPQGKPAIWRVTMLSGLLPDLSRFGHVKVCTCVDTGGGIIPHYVVKGWNRLSRIRSYRLSRPWGHFNASLAEAPDGRSALLLDYPTSKNGFFTSRIRDYVRVADDLSLIGQFRWMFRGRARLLGYFRLERIDG